MAVTTITTAAELAARLESEFGSFLEHQPHNPERFYGQAARSILRDLTPDEPVVRSVLGSIMNPPPPWKPFGFHAPLSPVPDLEFWGEDGSGDPLWERPVATGAGVVPAPVTVDREAANDEAHRRFPEGTVTDALERARFMAGAEWALALLPATVKPDREWLAGMIPLGFDPKRDGVSNVYEAADAILAAWPGRTGADVLNDAADALEGRLGTEGAPKTLWEFRQWLRTRARGEGRR